MPWHRIYCSFDRHRPETGKVRWSGTFHYGPCRDCRGTIRKSSKGYWKRLTTLVPTVKE